MLGAPAVLLPLVSSSIYFFPPTEENGPAGCCRLSCEGVAGQAGNATSTCADAEAERVYLSRTEAECRTLCSLDEACTAYEHHSSSCEVHTEPITTSQYYHEGSGSAASESCVCYVKASAAPPPATPPPQPP